MGKPQSKDWHQDEYIVLNELTQGTETSKYLEEKKSYEIPSVAASERGTGKTEEYTLRGCRADHKGE